MKAPTSNAAVTDGVSLIEVPAPNKLSAKEQELAELQDRYLRLAADFENFRKRADREASRRAETQKEAFIRDLLPVVDNLERALASAASSEQLQQGVQMTLQQLQQLLLREGVEPEDSLGQPFDPERHHAVQTRADPSQPEGVVLEVFQLGYRQDHKVLRPATVVVNNLSGAESASHAG